MVQGIVLNMDDPIQNTQDHDNQSLSSSKRDLLKAPPSPLNTRILAVNIIAIFVLGIGLLYLGHYQKTLIEKELNVMGREASIFVEALLEYNKTHIDLEKEDAKKFLHRLARKSGKKIVLFSKDGQVITRSTQGQIIYPPVTSELKSRAEQMLRFLDVITRFLLNFTPGGNVQNLELYPYSASTEIQDYPNALKAYQTTVMNASAWRNQTDDIVLMIAAPIMKGEHILGVLLLEKGDYDIKTAMSSLRSDILFVFLFGLFVTIMLSFYLASTIANPLRLLSNAADEVRRNKQRKIDIPDFSIRQDEIALLSETLRDMTTALWDRMDAIEQFAADVSHELKNPLTSLKSALETIDRIKDPEKKQKLMKIIHQDINRLDRLITDISDASRIDSEMSKTDMDIINLVDLLNEVLRFYRREDLEVKQTHSIVFDNHLDKPAIIKGISGRLIHVFQNLIDNAISFAPPESDIVLRLEQEEDAYIVYVEDHGPGIPLENLDKIFKRFYTERPDAEAFGNHSGLGLSIVKQIIRAHDADIAVSNMISDQGQVTGCRFTLTFKSYED